MMHLSSASFRKPFERKRSAISIRRFASNLCLLFLFAALFGETLASDGYQKIKVAADAVFEVPIIDHQANSPAVSYDGTKICWNGSPSKDRVPGDTYQHDFKTGESWRVPKRTFEFLNVTTKCSFAPSGELVVDEVEYRPGALLTTLFHYWFTHDLEPKGFHSTVTIVRPDGENIEYDRKDFHFPARTLMEHPRISPDGEWLAFYIKNKPKLEGIWVVHLESGRKFRLGIHPDKHPTWDASSTRLLFHSVGRDAKMRETSAIGYYDLVIDKDGRGEKSVVAANRVVLGDVPSPSAPFIYEKHPALQVGTGLLFFHAESPTKQKKFVGARMINDPLRRAMALELTYGGKRIKKAKHVTTSALPASPVYFIGTVEGEERDRLFGIRYEGVEAIQKALSN